MVEIAKLNEHGLEWKNYIKQSIQQIAADDYYDFWIVDMIKAPDWIIYMSTLLSWLFLTKIWIVDTLENAK